MRNAFSQKPAIESVDRAITLLQLIGRSGSARVGELAADLGVHASTVSRLLSTLERRGMVIRADADGTFALGSSLVELMTSAASQPHRLVDIARSTVLRVANDLGMTASLSTMIGSNTALTIDQAIASSPAVASIDWVGRPWPAHSSAGGKVLLAHLSTSELDQAMKAGLERFTEKTACAEPVLREQLADIARSGIAIVRDEYEIGLAAIASPIYAGERVVAALGVSGPTSRIDSDIDDLSQAVREAAAEIGNRNGAIPA